MGRDQAGDGGAVIVGFLAAVFGRRQCVETGGDAPGQFRMIGIDAGVDHRHQHVIAHGESVRLRQMQLGEQILRLAAFAGRVAAALAGGEQIIGLRRRYDPVGFKRAHHGRHRAAIRNTPAV